MALSTIAPSTKPSETDKGGEWGDPVIGCRLRIVSAPKEVSAGDALDVKVEVRNDGDSAIMFRRFGPRYFADQVEISAVADQAGIFADWPLMNRAAPKTHYATLRPPVETSSTTGVLTLQKGEGSYFMLRVNQLVDLSTEGDYEIAVKLQVSPSAGGGTHFVAAPSFRTKIKSPPHLGEEVQTDGK
jgi:hypothetical protein